MGRIRSRAGAEQEQSGAGQKEGRSWAGTREELGMCRIGACKEQGRIPPEYMAD